MSRINWCGQVLDDVLSPSVGLDKTIVRADDGTCIGIQNTITVKGYIIATGDPYTGERQDVLYKRINDFLIKGRNKTDASGNLNQQGLLEIIPVNGGANVLKFDNAQLTTLSLPEPPEETAGIQYQEYSFTFDAFENVGPTNSGDLYSDYRLKSVNESWEIAKNEDQTTYQNENFTEDLGNYTYTITHTVSAVGMQNYSSGNLDSTAWKQAYNYVSSRLKENVSATDKIDKDSYNRSTSGYNSVFNLNKWATESGGAVQAGYVAAFDSSYQSYSQVRTGSIDVAGGSYQTTSTYILSNGMATYDINIRYDEGEEGDVTVGIEGTVSPISTGTFTSTKNVKYAAVDGLYQKISDSGKWTKMTTLAQSTLPYYYDPSGNSITLDDSPRSISVGKNKTTGQVTFNLGYKGISSYAKSLKNQIPGAIAASLNISQDNPKYLPLQFQQVAVIPILFKSDGPILQDIATTKERKRTVQLDVTLKQGFRDPNKSPASSCYPIVAAYKPASNNTNSVYVQNFTDQWDWANGKYSLTVDWIYT
jgi:hypothetical protein